MKISATIITFNEEANIKDACESVAWADEILVVDSNSTDATREIAEACGARVIVNPWPGFGAQKQFAVEQAQHDWIFSLDADERVSHPLRSNIELLKNHAGAQEADGYRISRRTYYQQRWIRGGGWYPDKQLRLFNRTKGRWKQRHVHESVSMDDESHVGEIAGDWIFSLDADERVSHPLRSNIELLKNHPGAQEADGYRISRRTYYQQRWIRGGGWYPDKQLRLFNRTKGRWKQRHVHESVSMDDESHVGEIAGDLLHFTSPDAAHHHRMIGERYAPLSAQQMFEEGRRTSVFGVASAGPAAFIRSFILKGGFRDGLAGFTIASFAAHHAFLKHLMLWEKQSKEHPGTNEEKHARP